VARDPRHRVTDASDHAHRRLDDRSRFVVGGDVAPLRELGAVHDGLRDAAALPPSVPLLGPPKSRRLDEPITVSLANLVPQDHFYRHFEVTLDRPFVREGVQGLSAERGRPPKQQEQDAVDRASLQDPHARQR
jgi:hypothetical protein